MDICATGIWGNPRIEKRMIYGATGIYCDRCIRRLVYWAMVVLGNGREAVSSLTHHHDHTPRLLLEYAHFHTLDDYVSILGLVLVSDQFFCLKFSFKIMHLSHCQMCVS